MDLIHATLNYLVILTVKSFPSRVHSPTPAKTEYPPMIHGNVVDLAETSTFKKTNLVTLGIRSKEDPRH
jgi:hypothetical protein